ncbi:hypothetical protein CLV96_3897 [Leptospira meyeri]|uniref:Uncharacterized protein n=1 Tax=Leptospira meyeri TaxID=29508 RepID=A0A4R8MPV7_LEPME|nr:hypothetical protein [Leptospira meyeri]EKJ86159.1 hypothetical protein LEP1GSC017_0021 [Leptospira meyeri serovar Hardjo str. Went 5]TDY66518.1 hypothetical protein CLV96_3897 [Leptospira meyeri]
MASCPSCGVELKFLNTSLIRFKGHKICINCFQRSVSAKVATLEELKAVVQKSEIIEPEKSEVNSNIKPSETITIKTETKGFRFFRACLGMFALGPFGLLCGLCGSGKTKTTVIRN